MDQPTRTGWALSIFGIAVSVVGLGTTFLGWGWPMPILGVVLLFAGELTLLIGVALLFGGYGTRVAAWRSGLSSLLSWLKRQVDSVAPYIIGAALGIACLLSIQLIRSGALQDWAFRTVWPGEPPNNRYIRAIELGTYEGGNAGVLVEYGARYRPIAGIIAGVTFTESLKFDRRHVYFAAPGLDYVASPDERYEPPPPLPLGDTDKMIMTTVSSIGPDPNHSFYLWLQRVNGFRVTGWIFRAANEITTDSGPDLPIYVVEHNKGEWVPPNTILQIR